MSDIPAQTKKIPVKKKQTLTRGPGGRFVKSANDDNNVPVNIQDDPMQIPVNLTPGQNDTLMQSRPAGQFEQGGLNKEIQHNIEQIYLDEAEKTKELKEQLAELEKETEVKEIKGEIELPDMVKKAGVETAGEDASVPEQPTIVLPLDDTKIYNVYKKIKSLHQDLSSSVAWMVIWCVRQLAKVGIKLTDDHGKVIRETNKP